MSLRHSDIVIDENNPFANCKLERKKYADVLTQIVKAYDTGFVLAINNKWGTGKTTFVKMWQATLELQKYKAIYFNAWENDFEDNALTALMGELKLLISHDLKEDFKILLNKGAILSKHILPTLVKAIVAKHFDLKELQDFSEKATEGLTTMLEEDISLYIKKKKSIGEFKAELEKFIKKNNDGKPLIFIIDELDRCRPNYAVQILEQIKHFFSVKNIIFILSIDKEQLGNAIKGVYGNDRIDSEEYLKRFIDIEYSIPEPSTELFCRYLYNYFDFGSFFSTQNRLNIYETREDENLFIEMSIFLFKISKTSLRQQEKIYSHARVALKSFTENGYVFPQIFFILIFIKVNHKEFYSKIADKKLKLTELQSELQKWLITNNIEEDLYQQTIIEAYLLIFYKNYITTYYFKPKIYEGNGDKKEWIINSVFDNTQHNFRTFVDALDHRRSGPGLEYLLHKIELLDNLKD
ncbi:hypothetical protein AM493_20205 [Flavobacterium akiainvivens]|uniref:KAP NTPase domain-containing protein n=1 Tax=Flavobacterium akiainvivens TaxID=1202724 RepID=A0A0M9VJU3_9FLAO|nr:P-loop NTPase fold protein [Flavobacterium akiainvivens]KOS08110.1 hypothetical protein AM493_20205 [Flavobacterium akiainvivens]SFQ71970.1 KAP family P-loop domain-containing protein [Flavobacterium akiainvivens]